MTDCKMCSSDLFCTRHATVDDIADVDALWLVIRHFLSRASAEDRQRDRGVLMRRLRHPEAGGNPEYGQKMVEAYNSRIGRRPRLDPPMCECGKDARRHDQLTGECKDTGCEMFRAIS